MSEYQLPASRRRAPGAPNAQFACGVFGIARRVNCFVDSRKTKKVLGRSFLLTFFLVLSASHGHAQTGAELKDRSAKHAHTSDTWPQQAVRGSHAMVATDEALGSRLVPLDDAGLRAKFDELVGPVLSSARAASLGAQLGDIEACPDVRVVVEAAAKPGG